MLFSLVAAATAAVTVDVFMQKIVVVTSYSVLQPGFTLHV